MIMIPLLIMQILLFPLTASWLMNIWVNSRQNLALQDVSSHLGSTIQQLYFSLNHETISTAGPAKYLPELPPFIENHHYTGNATLRTVSDPTSSKILDLTLTLGSTGIKVTSSAVLGHNVLWRESTFVSNSTHACIGAEKFPNGTICLQFGE